MQQTLSERLAHADLFEAHNVSKLIASGASIELETESNASSVALLETYQTRAKHLAQFTSHHAKRLQRSTDEFCKNLAACPPERPIVYARIDDTILGSYVVWYVVDTLMPIGCLYVIGKTEVTDEIWERLWHDV